MTLCNVEHNVINVQDFKTKVHYYNFFFNFLNDSTNNKTMKLKKKKLKLNEINRMKKTQSHLQAVDTIECSNNDNRSSTSIDFAVNNITIASSSSSSMVLTAE